jgi:hypothetical protein
MIEEIGNLFTMNKNEVFIMLTPDEFYDLIDDIDDESSDVATSYQWGISRTDKKLLEYKDQAKTAYLQLYRELEIYKIALQKQRNG